MVLANRIKRYVAYDHHLVVRLRRYRMNVFARIVVQSRADFFVHESYATRRTRQAGPLGILSYALKDQFNARFDLLQIDRVFLRVRHPFYQPLLYRPLRRCPHDTPSTPPTESRLAVPQARAPASRNLHTQAESV